jgi:hypothetical protein
MDDTEHEHEPTDVEAHIEAHRREIRARRTHEPIGTSPVDEIRRTMRQNGN